MHDVALVDVHRVSRLGERRGDRDVLVGSDDAGKLFARHDLTAACNCRFYDGYLRDRRRVRCGAAGEGNAERG